MNYKKLKEEILSTIKSVFSDEYSENKKVQKSVDIFIDILKLTIENPSSPERPISPPGTNGGSTSGDKKKTRFGEEKIGEKKRRHPSSSGGSTPGDKRKAGPVKNKRHSSSSS
jgi:hypothetical protein